MSLGDKLAGRAPAEQPRDDAYWLQTDSGSAVILTIDSLVEELPHVVADFPDLRVFSVVNGNLEPVKLNYQVAAVPELTKYGEVTSEINSAYGTILFTATHAIKRSVSLQTQYLLLREYLILSKFSDCVNVIAPVELVMTPTFWYLVLPRGVSLDAVIYDPKIELLQKVRYCYHLCRGVMEVHERGFLHLDIKPNNAVLIKTATEDRIKLIDFGTARVHIKNDYRSGYEYHPLYRAPDSVPLGYATEIWALACCIYEFFAGQPLRTGYDETVESLVAKAAALPNPEVATLLDKCLRGTYTTVAELLSDKVFGVNRITMPPIDTALFQLTPTTSGQIACSQTLANPVDETLRCEIELRLNTLSSKTNNQVSTGLGSDQLFEVTVVGVAMQRGHFDCPYSVTNSQLELLKGVGVVVPATHYCLFPEAVKWVPSLYRIAIINSEIDRRIIAATADIIYCAKTSRAIPEALERYREYATSIITLFKF